MITERLDPDREDRIRRWCERYREGEFAPSSIGHDQHLMLAEIDALRAELVTMRRRPAVRFVHWIYRVLRGW